MPTIEERLQGSKVFRVVRDVVRIVAITFILLGVIEFISFLTVLAYKSITNQMAYPTAVQKIETAFGAKLDPRDVAQFRKESITDTKIEYYPYIGFRSSPNISGKFVNVDAESRRKTVITCVPPVTDRIVRIYMFGGSTMWGTGVRDEATIPSLLSTYLCEHNVHAEVINFGYVGYQSTQELIQFELELLTGSYPDVIIFYDGINDAYASYQNGVAGTPENVWKRYDEFNYKRKSNVLRFIENSNFMKIINEAKRRLVATPLPGEQSDTSKLWTDTVHYYANNIGIVEALSEKQTFKTFFYWQPTIFQKVSLSESEQKISKDKTFGEFYLKTTQLIRDEKNVIDISNIFNNEAATIFIDQYHLTEQGNKRIAEKFGADVIEYLKTAY